MSDAWVLATRNAGKLRELRALFAGHGIAVEDLAEAGCVEEAEAEEQIECFDTFEENALAKARYFAERLPGRVVVADDSGLAVDVLGGAPGVRSRRFSGAALHGAALDAANNVALLRALDGREGAAARFICAAAYVDGGEAIVRRGEVRGRVIADARGTEGFGYDPHFLADELGKTLAEAGIVEKQQVSHRGRAFEALLNAVALPGVGGS